MPELDNNEPCYVISVAAKMVGMHQQTLRYYERVGVIEPSRSRGNIRLYSQSDINRLRQIQRLINDLGVNLAGAEVIMRMRDRMEQMELEIESLRRQLAEARAAAEPGTQPVRRRRIQVSESGG
jgi:MerR family transcriptional regulator, heat shock protein HspR